MYPYVAFLPSAEKCNGRDLSREQIGRFRRIHPAWRSFDGGNGFHIFHLPPAGRSVAAFELPGGMGLILGTLFPKDLTISPENWSPQIDEACARKIVRTQGRHLIDNYWGGYVAFLHDCDRAYYVLRDSSARIPCYVVTHDDVTIIASNMEDMAGLTLPYFSLNTRYLAGFIYDAELSQRECGLNEVSELLAGECLELKSGHLRQFQVWDPLRICGEQVVENFAHAAQQVQQVTQACVDYWASRYDRIVHQLSGGLDSSLILGCLNRSAFRPFVTCLHLESGGGDDSDRPFAELAAKEAGTELVVQPGYSPDARYDDRIFRLPRAPKPSVANLGLALASNLRNALYAQKGAQAIWDGQGGDHLFFEPRSPFGAVDYAYWHGIAGDFPRCVRDAVRRSRLSYWTVIAKAIRLGLLRGRWQPEDQYDRAATFMNPDVVPANIAHYVWRTWSEGGSNVPPGKRWQIALLACLIHRHRPAPGIQNVCELHPLFSQPVVELCLRIPLFTLLRGGTDRALEREAFRDLVPEPIIRRENKGTVGITAMSKIRECMPFLRELVLDGVLVKERIIDRSALEPYLAGNRPMSNDVIWPFLSCIAAEAWARNWADAEWRV